MNNNLDIPAVRHRISQKFELSEAQIDESIIGLFLAIEKSHDKTVAEVKSLKQKYRSVEYDKASTAFWGELGSKGLAAIAISLAVVVCGSMLYSNRQDKILIQNLKGIQPKIEVREDGFYINSANLVKDKSGYYKLVTD